LRTVIPIDRGQHSDDRGQRAPVDGFKGSLGGVRVKLATFGRFFLWFAQGLAVERKAVRSVHEAVEDGIGDGRIDDHLVPVIDWEPYRRFESFPSPPAPVASSASYLVTGAAFLEMAGTVARQHPPYGRKARTETKWTFMESSHFAPPLARLFP
jgi:hypothetical protein